MVIKGEKKQMKPLIVNCFRCQKSFLVKFVVPTWNYSRKNSWDYWTENKADKDKKICDSCLLDMYYNYKQAYLGSVVDYRKRNLFRNYVSDKVIKDKESS